MNGEKNSNDVKQGSNRTKWDRIGRPLLIFGIPSLLFLVLTALFLWILSEPDLQLIARIGIQSVGEANSDMVSVVLPQIESSQNEESNTQDETESSVTQAGWSINKADIDAVMVHARILVEGYPMDSIQVWAVARDASGNSFCPETALSGNDGSVDLGPIPTVIGPDGSIRISRIKVQARYHYGGLRPIVENVVLRMDKPKTYVNISVSRRECLALGLIFLASILVAIVKARQPWLKQAKYNISVILTLLMCAGVIVVFMEGARVVDTLEQETGSTSVSLGFVQMVKASYFPDRNPDEWIVALTAPEGETLGFGAPLWVILVSVVGAVLISVGVIIQGLRSRDMVVSGGKRKKVPKMDTQVEVHKLLKHQLFILFAPIGAIFLYQMMLLTGTAGENLTVGVAALAAGGGLGLLLRKARKAVSKLLDENKKENEE